MVEVVTRAALAGLRNPQDGADVLAWQLVAAGLGGFERELQFHPTRKWRIDLAWPGRKLAVEVDGFGPRGTAGRHQRIAGAIADSEKYAELAIAGWRLMRVTSADVRTGRAMQWIERALNQ